jgi:hypothetical protein
MECLSPCVQESLSDGRKRMGGLKTTDEKAATGAEYYD